MNTDGKRNCEIAHDAISLPSKPAGAGLIHQELTEQIIGAAFNVHNTLGYGHLEKTYQNAMQVALLKRGLSAELERRVDVHYEGVRVGEYYADVVVDSKVLLEIKVAERYCPQDEAQLLNLLTSTGIKLGLLINFGRAKVEFKRMVM